MTSAKWIGTALRLALCTAALTACSQGGTSNQADANASADASGITLDQKAEKDRARPSPARRRTASSPSCS